MTIIDSPFNASDSLSWDVLLEYIAKLVAAWLYVLRKQKKVGLFLTSNKENKHSLHVGAL